MVTRAMDNEGYNLILLDEINQAFDFGLLKKVNGMDILHKSRLNSTSYLPVGK